MVMGKRPDVKTAGALVTAIDTAGLAGSFAAALARIPLRTPWRGSASPLRNVAVSSTRELVRSLMGYMTSLPIEEFRSLELLLDDVSRVVLPPFVQAQGVTMTTDDVDGVPGLWFRTTGAEPLGAIVYLHGGGYIGTSPSMYAVFMAHLARVTRCEVFVADYRLAPEFPYPASSDDIVTVIRRLHKDGLPSGRLLIAGDSGGGGLAGTVINGCARNDLPRPAAALLFSPEVSLALSEPSVTENASLDVLPWNIPTGAYLHGLDPSDAAVAILSDDLSQWPPTFVAFGQDEIFRDSIRRLVDRLAEAGVDHEAHEVVGMFHVFPFLLPWAHESRLIYDELGEFVARICELPVCDA